MPILEGYTDEEKARLGLLPNTIEALSAGFAPKPAPIVPDEAVARRVLGQPGLVPPPDPPLAPIPVPPTPQQRIDQAGDRRQAAIGQQASLAIREMSDRDIALKEHQRRVSDFNDVAVQEEDDLMGRIRSRMDSHEEKVREIQSLTVDPNRIFTDPDGSRNWTNTAMATIASALGAFGSAMTGSPNFAMQIVQKAIDRDIQAQKDQINKKGIELDESRNLLAQNYRLYGTEAQANLATRAQLGAAYKAQVDSIAASSNNAQQVAKLGSVAALAEQGTVKATQALSSAISDEERADAAEERMRRKSDAEAALMRSQARVDTGKASIEDTKMKNSLAASGVAMDPDTPVKISDGDLKDIRKQTANYMAFRTTVQDMVDLANSGEWSNASLTDRKKMGSIATRAILKLKNSEQAGALDKGMQEIAEIVIPNPNAWNAVDESEILVNLVKQLDKEHAGYVSGLGLLPLSVSTGGKLTPSGQSELDAIRDAGR